MGWVPHDPLTKRQVLHDPHNNGMGPPRPNNNGRNNRPGPHGPSKNWKAPKNDPYDYGPGAPMAPPTGGGKVKIAGKDSKWQGEWEDHRGKGGQSGG